MDGVHRSARSRTSLRTPFADAAVCPHGPLSRVARPTLVRPTRRFVSKTQTPRRQSRMPLVGDHRWGLRHRGDLWDVLQDEVALRYVLEDGKLNVCLRNLVEWQRFCRGRRHKDHADEADSVRESLDAFEKGMGIVLRNAWNHTEALQTTDIPLLVQYISEVVKDAAAEPERIAEMSRAGDLKDRQEVVCLSYLRGLLSRLGEREEERVMPMLRSAGIAADLTAMLHANHMHLGEEGRAVGAEALARICDTEDFRTYRDEYIRDVDKATFASMKTDFIGEICKDPAQRRALRRESFPCVLPPYRPLLDVISYCERSCPRK